MASPPLKRPAERSGKWKQSASVEIKSCISGIWNLFTKEKLSTTWSIKRILLQQKLAAK